MTSSASASACADIGVSNFEIEDLKAVQAAATKPLAMNQFETHPYYQRCELLAYCGEHGIPATAHSSMGGGQNAMRSFHASPPLTEDAAINAIAAKHATTPQATTAPRPRLSSFRARALSTPTPPYATLSHLTRPSKPALEPAARPPGQTVLLAWAVQRPTAILPKSVTPARIKANLDDVLALALDADDLAAISALDKPGLEGCYCHPKTPWLGRSAFTGGTDHYYG